MPTLLQVAQLGHPVLRKKSKPVKDIADRDTQKLIDDLLATVMEVDGLGISAPQVYVNQRIFINASHPNSRYPNAPEVEPTAIINPKVLSFSKEISNDWEGCLSIPGLRGLIPRPEKIVVEYFERDGKKVKQEFEGLLARIFQHELDHLDGLLFTDRVEDNKDLMTDKEYLKMIKISQK